MGAVNLFANITDGDDLLAAPVMANFQSITAVVNGGLQANVNVSTDTAVTQPGSANGEGTAATLARSDHKHLMQGFENLAADPTTGNFSGRTYWNTATTTLRYCSDPTGSGTFLDLTPTATSLVVHGAQHALGGHDPLPANIIDETFFKAKTNIFSATLASDSANFSGTAWTTIQDLTTVVTTNAQTLGVAVELVLSNADSSAHNAGFRVVDVTDSNTTIYRSGQVEVDHTTQTQLSGFFFYTTPSGGGTRTLRVQGGATTGGQVNAIAPTGFNTETLKGPTISAVIL